MTQSEQLNILTTPLTMAITSLRLNGRYEAAKFEPMNSGLNEKPITNLKKTKWNSYKHSVLLVPGLGPEDPAVTLDSGGAWRCRAAAELFKKGAAPFIVVSGGNVHPFLTPYNEAVEMKRYMVEQLKIPENVIFIEPHARHTTTNIRNTNRMIFNFGIPANKSVLIISDSSQTKYIQNGMAKTAMRDLGYLPYENLIKLSEEQTSYVPNKNSLQTDASDPLDP